jgi:predicted PurR-regulated permease PerM
LIFVALLIGAKIAGILGVIIAVPVAGTIKGTIDAIRVMQQSQVIVTEMVSPESSHRVSREESVGEVGSRKEEGLEDN